MSYFEVSITKHSLSSNKNKIGICKSQKIAFPENTDNQTDNIELEIIILSKQLFPIFIRIVTDFNYCCDTPIGEILSCKSSINYVKISTSYVLGAYLVPSSVL